MDTPQQSTSYPVGSTLTVPHDPANPMFAMPLVVAYVRLRPRMRRYSVRRLGRRTWAADPGLGSVLGSFIHVRGRSPVVTRIVFARLADGDGRP